MTKIILEVLSSELVTSMGELREFMACTLSTPLDPLETEVEMLASKKIVCVDEERIAPSQFGRAILASSLDLNSAIHIFNDLEKGMQSLALDSEIHMLFLVTPINNSTLDSRNIDWSFYHEVWMGLTAQLRRVADLVGVRESFLMCMLSGVRPEPEKLKTHIRFFTALILHDLINETPIDVVARKFKLNKGLLQTLQQTTATYAYMIVAFCDRLGWFYLKILLDGFAERLQFGVRRDLTELVRVPGVDAVRARAFHQEGIKSLAKLAKASSADIRRILRKAVPFPSYPNAEQGKNTWLFGEEQMEDFAAAECLIERAYSILSESKE